MRGAAGMVENDWGKLRQSPCGRLNHRQDCHSPSALLESCSQHEGDGDPAHKAEFPLLRNPSTRRGRLLKRILPIVALAISTGSLAQALDSQTPLPTISLPADLQRILTDYETAWRARDAVTLSRLFTDDGFVLSSGHPPIRGRDAIKEHYSGAGGALSLRALAFATSGSVGYIVGVFSRSMGAPDLGKFTLTLQKRTDGRWLIVSDMDNGNQSPRP
jgi:ketosteroid isomerase-like protein